MAAIERARPIVGSTLHDDWQEERNEYLKTLEAILQLSDTAPNPMTQQLMRGVVAEALTRMGAM
jgi:hypothetical protein